MEEVENSSKKLRDEGMRLLRNRVKRLVTLLNAKGPDVILVQEVWLIHKAAMMLDLKAWHDAERSDFTRQWKEGLGLCHELGCDDGVAKPQEQCDGSDASAEEWFLKEYCRKHAEENLAEMKALDEAEEPNTDVLS